jgi:hypothetical protein
MAVKIGNRWVTTGDIMNLTNAAVEQAEAPQRKVANRSLRPDIENTLREWVKSNPWDFSCIGSVTKLGTIRTTFGMVNNQPKAYWKQFANETECYTHLINESDKRLIKNKSHEVEYANKVLTHQPTARVLNDLRRQLGDYLWSKDGVLGKLSHVVLTETPLNLLPNLSGSYNEANSYPAYERSAQLEGWDPISIARNWITRPFYDYGMSHRDRLGLMFERRDFTVAENVAILHDIKELFSPRWNSRALPTTHSELIPHPYQGAESPPMPQRWNEDEERIDVLLRNLNPVDQRTRANLRRTKAEVKWDQGRNGAGTRNELSPDTQTARAKLMPLETGRSHTAARLFEMVSLLRPETRDPRVLAGQLRAMAFGIFAYWNGDERHGGYPKSLTPIHTYHEVMDPAEDYLKGIYKQPFTYEDLKDYLDQR